MNCQKGSWVDFGLLDGRFSRYHGSVVEIPCWELGIRSIRFAAELIGRGSRHFAGKLMGVVWHALRSTLSWIFEVRVDLVPRCLNLTTIFKSEHS